MIHSYYVLTELLTYAAVTIQIFFHTKLNPNQDL